MRKAEVLVFGKLAGWLVEDDDGEYAFGYSSEYLSQSNPIPVSLTIPISSTPVHYRELPESEYFAMMLANRCGIDTGVFGLVRLASGDRAYLTRRMDREDGI